MLVDESSTSSFIAAKTILIGGRDPTREEKSTCQLCKKSFKTESYMKLHLLTHTGDAQFDTFLITGFIYLKIIFANEAVLSKIQLHFFRRETLLL